VNFLRFKDDNLVLNRNYFPGVDLNSFDENAKSIINEIEGSESLMKALKLPIEAKFVFTQLLCITKTIKKLENTLSEIKCKN
jgi:hypothetical protein